MIRHLAPLPAAYSFGQVEALTRTRFPTQDGVGHVATGGAGSVAVYLPDPQPSDAALGAWRADVAAHVPVSPTPEETAAAAVANESTLRQQAELGLAQLQAIIDAADPAAGTLTTAQLSNAVRQLTAAVKTEARIQRRLIRLAISKLDGTD